MRNRNFTLLFVALIGFLVTFASCKNETTPLPDGLVGTWTVISVTGDGAANLPLDVDFTLTFDGTAEGNYTIRNAGGAQVETGTYTYAGPNGTLDLSGTTVFVNDPDVALNGNTLTATVNTAAAGKTPSNAVVTAQKNQ